MINILAILTIAYTNFAKYFNNLASDYPSFYEFSLFLPLASNNFDKYDPLARMSPSASRLSQKGLVIAHIP